MNDLYLKAFMTATSYLSDKLWRASYSLSAYQREHCEEIRLRIGRSAKAYVDGSYITLTDKGNVPIVTKDDINHLIQKATKLSIHSFCEQIKMGFITTDEGHRIGICGEIVQAGDNINTIKNISSVNIRITKPNVIASNKIINYIMEDKLKNTLVISEAGYGKTTLLREIAKNLSLKYATSIVDERYELAGNRASGHSIFDVGDCDVISGGNKRDALNMIIRNMASKVIIIDEITNENDAEFIKRISYCGNKLFVSAHCGSINELYNRPIYKTMIDSEIFELIIQIDCVKSQRNYRVFSMEEYNDIKDNRNGYDDFIKLGNRHFFEQML